MLTVKRQFDRIVITVIAFVVIWITLAFFLIEIVSFRQVIVENLIPQAETLAINLKRSLVLSDRNQAQEILRTLSTDSSVDGAYLFNRQDEPFSFYQPKHLFNPVQNSHNPATILDKKTIQALLAQGRTHTQFVKWHLTVFVPIEQDGKKIGSIYLISDLQEFYYRLFYWIAAAVGVTLAATAAGMVFSSRLQKQVTEPIARLTEQVAQVSTAPNLQPNQGRVGDNEIEALEIGFYDMLARIADHEHQMNRVNESLEMRIMERTEELSLLLLDKEMILREVHHRVKNNLQVITSLLGLQMKRVNDPAAKEALRASLGRTRSISLIHEKLYAGGQTPTTDLGRHLADLAQEIFRLHQISDERIRLRLELADCHIDLDTLVNLALILNELLTNTFKHAFPGETTGNVLIRLTTTTDQLMLTVIDDGVGLPPDFSVAQSSTLGLRLAQNLARQTRGSFTLKPGEPGTEAMIVCPLPHQMPLANPAEGK